MNRTFDFYEYAGFIIPGAVLTIVGLMLFFPEARTFFSKEGVTFGELGIFVIVAYAAGQLVQGVGNLVEWLLHLPLGGKYSDRALGGKFLSNHQHKQLVEAIKKDPKISIDITKCDANEYRSIVLAIYAIVSGAGKANRVDAFNGNFGLLRGLAASFIILIGVALFLGKGYYILAILALLLFLAIQRMNRYSANYTRELFTQYLLLERQS